MDNLAVEHERGRRHRHGAFLPLLLMVVALAAVVVIQAQQTLARRDALMTLQQAQSVKVDTSAKVQQQLSTLIARTRELADAGNAPAERVLQRFRQAGIDLGTLGVAD